MPVDLHLHTRHSDGNWTPAELVEKAVELKLSHIAITDHDTTAGINEAVAAAAGRLEVIPGIEINTVWHGAGGDEDVHILGYFIDQTSRELKELLLRQQAARIRLVNDTIDMLSSLGLSMTFQQVQSYAGTGSIGRPHITQAIVEAGGAGDVNEAYQKFMTRGSAHYVARSSVTPAEAVKAINAAGGLASVAHPGKAPNIEKILLELKAAGLKAVEAYHRRHSVELVQHYIRFANRNQLLITGGSDCHGPYKTYPPSIGTISVPLSVVQDLKTSLALVAAGG